jgi:hypothetical protein
MLGIGDERVGYINEDTASGYIATLLSVQTEAIENIVHQFFGTTDVISKDRFVMLICTNKTIAECLTAHGLRNHFVSIFNK